MKLIKDITKLKRKSVPATEADIEFIQQFKTFVLAKTCRGLCAAQVGKPIRVIGIKSKDRKRVCIMVNPEIVKSSKKTVVKPESNVILGNKVQVPKERPKWVKVKYTRPDFKGTKTKFFFKRNAAAACHLCDMLEGILIV